MKRLINVLVGCVLAGAAVVLGPSTAYAMELREDALRSPIPPVKTYVLQEPKLVLEERCLPGGALAFTIRILGDDETIWHFVKPNAEKCGPIDWS